MKVYLVLCWFSDYDDFDFKIEGVFKSKTKAQEHVEFIRDSMSSSWLISVECHEVEQ